VQKSKLLRLTRQKWIRFGKQLILPVMLKPNSLAGYALFGIIESFENHGQGVKLPCHGLLRALC
jgi:hypothetical protein